MCKIVISAEEVEASVQSKILDTKDVLYPAPHAMVTTILKNGIHLKYNLILRNLYAFRLLVFFDVEK